MHHCRCSSAQASMCLLLEPLAVRRQEERCLQDLGNMAWRLGDAGLWLCDRSTEASTTCTADFRAALCQARLIIVSTVHCVVS